MTNSKLFLSLLLAGTVGSVSAQSLKDAKAAMASEQFDKAKGILQNLVNKKANVGENYFYLGQIHIVNDKIDSAEYVFKAGLTNDPKDQLNTVGLGLVDLMKGNQAAGETKFATAVSSLGKKDYLPLYYIGRAFIEAPKPDYTKAIEYLTQAQAKNAKDALIPVAIGDAYVGLSENSQAYINYRNALNIDPSLLNAKVSQAVITRRAQAYDVAIQNLNDLAAENPDYAPIYRELAETYYLSSLKQEQEQYRETNKTAVDFYKKYLSLTGDNSVEAKTRYADFLVYSGNYDELKIVSQELANAQGVDAKVFRYLGYISFNQDKDYAKAVEYLGTLFEKMPVERLISRDYLFAGLANISAGDQVKGEALLKEAVAKQGEDDDLMAEIAETAFAKYQDGEVETAVKIFAIPAADSTSDYYYDANYYIGIGEYGVGSKIVSPAEGEEVTAESGAAKLAAATPHLNAAIKALTITAAATKEDVKEKYHIRSLYYKGLSEMGVDNLLYDPENAKGLFVDSFTQLIEAVKATGKTDAESVSFIVDGNNYLGYYYYLKGDTAKAKVHFQNTLAVSPEDDFAGQFAEL